MYGGFLCICSCVRACAYARAYIRSKRRGKNALDKVGRNHELNAGGDAVTAITGAVPYIRAYQAGAAALKLLRQPMMAILGRVA